MCILVNNVVNIDTSKRSRLVDCSISRSAAFLIRKIESKKANAAELYLCFEFSSKNALINSDHAAFCNTV